jgi:hypothetical protein
MDLILTSSFKIVQLESEITQLQIERRLKTQLSTMHVLSLVVLA